MPTTRPNILLITTDQQRGDCIGLDPLAPPALQTPNLDWLAKSGAHFLHAYAECPSCIPARRSLMTGMAPAANGAVGFKGAPWDPPHTLASELSRAGYQSEMIGKLHLHPLRKRFGFDHLQLADATRGKDNEYVDWLQTRHGRHDADPGMGHGVSSNGWVGRPHHLPEEQMHTFWCIDRALDFLRKRDPEAPFFLNISFIDPHPPLTPPALYYQRYIERDLPEAERGDWAPSFDGPQRGLDPNASQIHLNRQDLHCARAAYYGMVNFIDDQLGRLSQFAGGLLDEAFVLYTSDHGEMLGDHNLFRKTWPYEASARIPFIVRPPKSWGLDGGLINESPVGLQDVMPTLLDAAGLDVPQSCTGHSLLPLLKGDSQQVRQLLHGEHAGCYAYDQGNHFVTDGHHKYIWYSQTGREQLFDLDADPHECRDLARTPDADALLEPWRQKLVGFLHERPEGFVEDGQLVAGRRHDPIMPDYEPDRVYPFL
ncbi:MAG: arylsulfatase [Candidatus Latescibacteria bacterium]|nr:arylsulfatase [Candidatus Latescibacterota bacterium]